MTPRPDPRPEPPPTPPTAAGWDALLDRFRDVRALVVGETVLDGWLSGPSRGLSREAPVPVVRVVDEAYEPGAGANTARSLAALGTTVRFVSATGADRDGEEVRALLAAAGVAADSVLRVPGRRTVGKRRVLAAGQLLLRSDTGDTGPLPSAAAAALSAAVVEAVPTVDVVLACDYSGGLFTDDLLELLGRACAAHDVPLLVDAHEPRRWARTRPTAVKPDAEELATLLPAADRAGFLADGADRVGTVVRRSDELLAASGAELLLATLDVDGAVVLQPGAPPYRVHAEQLALAHTAGAGDTFLAGFAAALAAGADPRTAAEVAGAAAAVVVRRPGTGTCTLPELRDRLAGARDRVLPVDRLARSADGHRALGRRLVFTNGCFDVLHRGHVAYLQAAKAQGDVLYVALNSDESVRRLKGPDRPVNGVADRVAVLAALSAVDHLVVFDGDTPADLLRLVRPDVYVKGGDYTPAMLDELPEAPLVRALGGDVRIVDYVEDRSTSSLLERVRRGGA